MIKFCTPKANREGKNGRELKWKEMLDGSELYRQKTDPPRLPEPDATSGWSWTLYGLGDDFEGSCHGVRVHLDSRGWYCNGPGAAPTTKLSVQLNGKL